LTTVAYIANEFPATVEPYVVDEINELRRRGARVLCCSVKRAVLSGLNAAEREIREQTHSIRPLPAVALAQAVQQIACAEMRALSPLLQAALDECKSPIQKLRAIGHTVLGAALARTLDPLRPNHIHAHHGYSASWIALVAARLLGIEFSFTLHGSDLLLRAELLGTKLRFCRFCITVSDFNRKYILDRYPTVPARKVMVQRLGVDRVFPPIEPAAAPDQPFLIFSVGRLHRVKDYGFLIRACALLRDHGHDFRCSIAGDGPERPALERQIAALKLQRYVRLLGHIPRTDLSNYYRRSDLVVLTSRSEGIPVVLMEAMAHQRLVLAPGITGIPELVEHGRTGFLYEPGSMSDFVNTVCWILAHRSSFTKIRRAAAANVYANYNRQRNLRQFADHFLDRISIPDRSHEDSLLQQVQLSV